MSEGFVYMLINAAMPDHIKIGLTQQDEVQDRIRQLDNTSTPLPFECHFAAKVPDCRRLERTLHFVFGEKRTRLNRELFTAHPDVVKAVIELVAIKEEPLTDADQAISPEQRVAIEATERVLTSPRIPPSPASWLDRRRSSTPVSSRVCPAPPCR